MKPESTGEWKCPVFEGFCPTAIDWAQLAAYIDGEGSILINTQRWVNKNQRRKNAGLSLRLTIANTDIRLLVWLRDTFGGNIHDANTDKYYAGKNWKRAYHWDISTCHAAWALFNCLPYFKMKREQAEIGIALQDSRALFKRGRGKELPEDVRQYRQGLKDRLLVLKAKGVRGIPVPSGGVTKQVTERSVEQAS